MKSQPNIDRLAARIATLERRQTAQRLTPSTGGSGVPGAPGSSAYEVAVDNGFVGDEAAWLASLQGEDGTDGQDGVDGSDAVLPEVTYAELGLSSSTGTINSSTPVPVNWSSIVVLPDTTKLTLDGTSVFRLVVPGTLVVQAGITIDETSGNNRTEFRVRLEASSDGVVWVPVAHTMRAMYSRLNVQGAGSAQIYGRFPGLPAGRRLRVVGWRQSGTATGTFLADACSLHVSLEVA